MNARVKITFYNSENEEIRCVILDCYKCNANCEELKITGNVRSMVVCFTTEYNSCSNCI